MMGKPAKVYILCRQWVGVIRTASRKGQHGPMGVFGGVWPMLALVRGSILFSTLNPYSYRGIFAEIGTRCSSPPLCRIIYGLVRAQGPTWANQ